MLNGSIDSNEQQHQAELVHDQSDQPWPIAHRRYYEKLFRSRLPFSRADGDITNERRQTGTQTMQYERHSESAKNERLA